MQRIWLVLIFSCWCNYITAQSQYLDSAVKKANEKKYFESYKYSKAYYTGLGKQISNSLFTELPAKVDGFGYRKYDKNLLKHCIPGLPDVVSFLSAEKIYYPNDSSLDFSENVNMELQCELINKGKIISLLVSDYLSNSYIIAEYYTSNSPLKPTNYGFDEISLIKIKEHDAIAAHNINDNTWTVLVDAKYLYVQVWGYNISDKEQIEAIARSLDYKSLCNVVK